LANSARVSGNRISLIALALARSAAGPSGADSPLPCTVASTKHAFSDSRGATRLAALLLGAASLIWPFGPTRAQQNAMGDWHGVLTLPAGRGCRSSST
jgi:hypothetical protein